MNEYFKEGVQPSFSVGFRLTLEGGDAKLYAYVHVAEHSASLPVSGYFPFW